MPSEIIQMHVSISGIVQGVFFRAETEKTANKNNVKGWVRNLDDGSVEAVFEGSREDVENTIQWCHQGASAALVSNVETEEQTPLSNFDKFEIR